MAEAKKTTKLSRRRFLKTGLYGTLATTIPSALWLNGCQKKWNPVRPNILFISIDTLRADHLSCYGYPRQTSPNIDALAAGAHRFKRAYTVIPTTLPSHMTMFTSMYPTQLAITRNGHYVNKDIFTLPEMLKQQGYSTAAFVNYFVLSNRYGFTKGFDTAVSKEGHADQPLRYALQWLKEYKSDRPFFMFAHFFDPHTRYEPIDRFRKKFDVTDRRHPLGFGFTKNRDAFTPQVIKEDIDAYDAQIASSDWAVGQLLDALKKLKLEDDTMVVLVSDHGESLDELAERNYFFDHSEFLYNHQLNVPLIIRLPKTADAPTAMVHDLPVSTVDLTPTILGILGITPPEFAEGKSLLPALAGSKMKRGPVFSEIEAPVKNSSHKYSVIDDQWHLIMSKKKRISYELFDLINDPAEKNDLYRAQPGIAKKLSKELRTWTSQLERKFTRPSYEKTKKQLDKLRSLGYAQ